MYTAKFRVHGVGVNVGRLTLPYDVNGRINWYNLLEVSLAIQISILSAYPFFNIINFFRVGLSSQ